MPARLLNVRDVASTIGISEETVRRWLRHGLLHGIKPGGDRIGYRIPESELQRMSIAIAASTLTVGSSEHGSPVPDDLRRMGWMVAVHNDYTLNGEHHTFWLFTSPKTGRFVKGEGHTDVEALDAVRRQLEQSGSAS